MNQKQMHPESDDTASGKASFKANRQAQLLGGDLAVIGVATKDEH